MSLINRLIKNSTIEQASVLTESKIYGRKDMVKTSVPMINVALSGSIEGGLTPGLTVLAGPSKHFKSAFSLLMAAAYMKKYPDSVLLFYDSEFGTPEGYFSAFEIDMERVIHIPITDIEQLKFDIMGQLTSKEGITRNDKVVIVIDSVGNLASKKEVEDAIEGKSVGDMSRAKALKSLFRMVTPHLTLKDIPLIAVNHTYKTMEMYSKDVVGGGCVVGGTKIKLPDGTLKTVEDFAIGDMVQTLLGPKEVTHIWNPETLVEGEPECYEIEFEDGFKVVCSDEHKFLIDDVWIEAKNLKVGLDCTVSVE
jgi:hypothetical protein